MTKKIKKTNPSQIKSTNPKKNKPILNYKPVPIYLNNSDYFFKPDSINEINLNIEVLKYLAENNLIDGKILLEYKKRTNKNKNLKCLKKSRSNANISSFNNNNIYNNNSFSKNNDNDYDNYKNCCLGSSYKKMLDKINFNNINVNFNKNIINLNEEFERNKQKESLDSFQYKELKETKSTTINKIFSSNNSVTNDLEIKFKPVNFEKITKKSFNKKNIDEFDLNKETINVTDICRHNKLNAKNVKNRISNDKNEKENDDRKKLHITLQSIDDSKLLEYADYIVSKDLI